MHISGIAKKLVLALGLPVMANAAFNYWDVNDTATVPKKLSLTGLYTNITAVKKTMIADAYHFEVNSALWSDGAHKMRWVLLKDRNKASIQYSEKDDYWGYPDSTLFIKNFAVDTVPGDTTTRLLFETRFLINRKDPADPVTGKKLDQWYGYSYKWQRDQKDALLVDNIGADDSVRVFPTGIGAGKPSVMKKWRFPSRSQCSQCHKPAYADTLHGRSVLGFFTAQLNRPHPDVANINQLEYFFQQKVLSGVKSTWAAASTPRWYGVDDNSASVDVRARAYIAANCSGCHGRRGIENGATFGVDLNYDFHTMESKMEFRHKSTSWAFGLDTIPPTGMAKNPLDHYYYPKNDANNPNHKDSLEIVPALVVPGYPEKSVILFRQTSRNTRPSDYDPERNQMPPLASFEVNQTATQLIAKWIKEMPALPAPGCCTGIRTYSVRTHLKGPAIENRQVVLPMELAGPGQVRVILTGIDGRAIELVQKSRTHYALPAHITPGVYLIRVNNKSFTQYLF